MKPAMSSHNLCSPSNTYLVLPSVRVLNKDQGQHRKLYTNKDPILLRNVPGIASARVSFIQSEKVPKLDEGGFTRNKIPQFRTVGTQHVPSENTMAPNRVTVAGRQLGGNSRTVSGARVIPVSVPDTSRDTRTQNVGAVLDSDSTDSDVSIDEDIFHSRKLERTGLTYTKDEDVEILNYVLKGSNIERTGGLLLWKELEKIKKTHPKRTYQSLKNRFLRNIKPHLLTKFQLSQEAVKKVKKHFPNLRSRAHELRMNDIPGRTNLRERTRPKTNEVVTPRTDSSGEATSSRVTGTNESQRREEQSARVSDATTENQETNEIEKNQPAKRKTPEEEMQLERRRVEQPEMSKAVELFVPNQASNAGAQTFQCTKIIRTLQDKTNLNLNIVLVNNSSLSFLSRLTGPVKVDVVVSVSPMNGNVNRESRVETLESAKPSVSAKKARKKLRKKPRKNQSNCKRKRYVLTLKDKCHQKLDNFSLARKKTIAKLLEKMGTNQKNKSAETEKAPENCKRLLRCHTRQAAVVDHALVSQSVLSSQATNCSVDVDSDYSQMLNQLAKARVIMAETSDTQTEKEEQEEGEISRKRRRRKNENPPNNKNILLKNMVGMLSPSSKVFSDGRSSRKSISKKL